VQAQRKTHVLQRLLLYESLADQLENRHLLIGPFDFSLALFRQTYIANIARGTLRSLRHANFSSGSSSTATLGCAFFLTYECCKNRTGKSACAT
jgi:hypothetical protein